MDWKDFDALNEALEHLDDIIDNMECCACREEHIQLKEWLLELKQFKIEKGI